MLANVILIENLLKIPLHQLFIQSKTCNVIEQV